MTQRARDTGDIRTLPPFATTLDVQWLLTVEDTAAHEARTRLTQALFELLVHEDTIADAVLLVSEIVTNVWEHSAAHAVSVRTSVLPGELRVEVEELTRSDTFAPLVARPSMPDAAAVSGRGLAIVDAIAERWGVTRHQKRTTIWFTLTPKQDTHSDAPDPDAELHSVQAALRRSQMLLRLTEALSSAESRTDIADGITRVLRSHVGAVFTGVALLEPDRAHLRYLSLDPLPAEIEPTWTRFRVDTDAPVAAAVANKRAYFHSDSAAADIQFPGIGEHMQQAHTGAVAHLPLIAAGQTIGVLAVGWTDARTIDADLRALLTIVAGYAAQALRRSST